MASSLFHLPHDVLSIIVEFMPEHDIAALMATCRKMYTALECNPIWKQRFILYSRSLRTNADFASDNSPSWRLLTVFNSELQDHLYYSVDVAGQRGWHPELRHADVAVQCLPGRWRQALFSLLNTRCESCSNYCGTFHLLLMMRLCDHCAQEHKRFAVVTKQALSREPTIPAEEISRLPSRTLAVQNDESMGMSTAAEHRTYYAMEHCMQLFARYNLGTRDLLKAKLSGRFALAHVGYLVNPFRALISHHREEENKMAMDSIIDSIGGPRASHLRTLWDGVQSAAECRCGAQGPPAAMQDHYEIVHCRRPWTSTFGPDTQRLTTELNEMQLRDFATRNLQNFIDFGDIDKKEMPHILDLARSVQPISHWHESLFMYEQHHDCRFESNLGEQHGTFVVHGRQRLLCWYRIESEETVYNTTHVGELVACPMHCGTQHSKVGTRILCIITTNGVTELVSQASDRELGALMAMLGLNPSVKTSTFMDLLLSNSLRMFTKAGWQMSKRE